MIKTIAKRVFAALMAVWAAWSLGNLSADLRETSQQAAALEAAVGDARTQIECLSDPDPEQLLKSMGYVHRGDILFFDGG